MTIQIIRKFTRSAALCLAGAIIAVTAISAAGAATTTFIKPKHGGDRLDLCVDWAQGCGKPAANAFCKAKGFDKTVGYSVDHNIGQSTPTRLIGTGAVCDQGFCDGFKAIKCEKTVQSTFFYKPKWKGDRLDVCVNWAQGCGKPAANAFCQAKGFAKSTGFSIEHNIGTMSPTRLIGTGALCDQGFCDGFKGIKCSN